MSRTAATSFVPTLSRLLLALVFISAGWNKCFTEVSYTAAEAGRLEALGVELVEVSAVAEPVSFRQDSGEPEMTEDDDVAPLVETPEGVSEARAAGLWKIALMVDDLEIEGPDWLPRVAAIGAAATELVGGAMILIGLFSRIWALGLALTMGTAFYMTSWPTLETLGWNPLQIMDDSPIMYQSVAQLALGLMAFGIVLTGAGPMSLDRIFFGAKKGEAAVDDD